MQRVRNRGRGGRFDEDGSETISSNGGEKNCVCVGGVSSAVINMEVKSGQVGAVILQDLGQSRQETRVQVEIETGNV